MNIIKQKFLNTIVSFICCIILVGCQSNREVATPLERQKTIEIAILMPLTGDNAALGQQYNKLIKIGIEDGLQSYVHVTSYDGSDEKQIAAAMDKIIERKTKIILGPLSANLASMIANKAKAYDIIVITMSNNPVLADTEFFVFGHAPLKQLTKIINYFVNNDYSHFITLLPEGQNSKATNQIIQDLLIQKNAYLVRSEFYSNLPESINKAVANISKRVDNLNEQEDVSKKPVIYISDDSKNMNLLFDSISKYNLDKKAIIVGDNRIDIDYPDQVNITFTGSLNILNNNIVERSKDIGINHLSFMHAMAYDLGKMTAKYIGTDFNKERFLAVINSKIPYVGISGNIHFIDSIAQREYSIIKKENSVYSTLLNN